MSTKKKQSNIPLSLEVSIFDVVSSVCSSGNHETIKELILQLDLEMADAGFTEDLIKSLASSLCAEYTEAEWNSLVDDVASLRK